MLIWLLETTAAVESEIAADPATLRNIAKSADAVGVRLPRQRHVGAGADRDEQEGRGAAVWNRRMSTSVPKSMFARQMARIEQSRSPRMTKPVAMRLRAAVTSARGPTNGISRITMKPPRRQHEARPAVAV